MNNTTRYTPFMLIMTGIVMAVNPLYLDGIVVYPGRGMMFAPFHSAVLSIGGLLIAVTGVFQYKEMQNNVSNGFFVVWVAITSLAVFIVLESVLVMTGEHMTGQNVNYGIRKVVVAGLVVSAFSLAGTIRARNVYAILVTTVLAAFFFAIGVFEWQFDPILGPIVDLWFLLTGSPLFGIKYGGSFLLLLIVLFGLWVGVPEE